MFATLYLHTGGPHIQLVSGKQGVTSISLETCHISNWHKKPKQVIQLSRSGTSRLLNLQLLNPELFEVDCRCSHSMILWCKFGIYTQSHFCILATNLAGPGGKPSLRTNGETEVKGRSGSEPGGICDSTADSLGLVDRVATPYTALGDSHCTPHCGFHPCKDVYIRFHLVKHLTEESGILSNGVHNPGPPLADLSQWEGLVIVKVGSNTLQHSTTEPDPSTSRGTVTIQCKPGVLAQLRHL